MSLSSIQDTTVFKKSNFSSSVKTNPVVLFGFKNFLVIKNLDIISFNVYKLYLKYAFENFIKISSDMVLISSILIILYTET